MARRVLAVNPGSTTTKITVFEGEQPVFDREIVHPREELSAMGGLSRQLEPRLEAVRAALDEAGEAARGIVAVVGRGGLLAPLTGGAYAISQCMLDDLAGGSYGVHACNLGAPMALALAEERGVPSLVADPPVTDEMDDAARLTGLPGLKRRSIFHALSQRGSAREAAARRGVDYAKGRFIVVHLGGGISLGAHRHGRVADVINALDGEGPMTPERSGSLPVLDVLSLLERGEYDIETLRRTVLRRSGLLAHLGTNDFREVERRVNQGDAEARAVFEALVYTIAKHASSLVPVLVAQGDPLPVDAVVLTGGMARSSLLTDALSRLLDWAGPVEVVTGLEEMLAMARNAWRVLDGEEVLKEYKG